MRLPIILPTLVLFPLLVASPGCRPEHKEFVSSVTLNRISVVERDDKGNAVSTDVELRWKECPGEQLQLMRSGKEFSECMKKHKPGETAVVKVLWEWDEHGHYDWHVIDVGGCPAPPVDDDDSSFDQIQECVPSIQHDAVVGFHCDRLPEGELLEKCPWFRRQ